MSLFGRDGVKKDAIAGVGGCVDRVVLMEYSMDEHDASLRKEDNKM